MTEDPGQSPKELLDELFLDGLAPRTLGNAPKEVYVEYERDLTQADLEALQAPRGIKSRSLVRIHASHHALAKCLAVGMKPSEAALITGYTANRISILQNDEAFQALVADYRAESKSLIADQTERMTNISLDAMELLHERLLDDPGQFSVPMLLDVVKAMADRTGHGPGAEVNLKVQASDMIDRPPRETFEEWEKRRLRQLEGPERSLN
jgi:hypothetical protein